MRLLLISGFVMLSLSKHGFIIQETTAQNFTGGLLAGITASEISGDQLARPHKAGPLIGAFVNHKLEDDLSLQFEMYYVQKGSRKNPNPDNNDFTKYILRINYIEMPILLVWEKYENLWFQGGLATAVHFSDSEYDESGLITRPSSAPVFKPLDISLMLGLNYKLTEKLKADFRYSNSLFAVRDHSGSTTYYLNKGQYNAVWYLSLRYYFSYGSPPSQRWL